MALVNKKLTDQPEKILAPGNALIHFVDPEDISQSPEGSSFKITKDNFLSEVTEELEGLATVATSGDYNDLINKPDLSLKADLVGGLVPSSQLPSYVDDIIEGYLLSGVFYSDSGHTTAITGGTGKIYVDLTISQSSKQYRWTGSAYLQITNGLIASTSDVPEGTNLYFTTARVLATVLTGISFATGGAIVSTDTVLQAFGKIQKQINDLSTTYQAILTDVNFGSFINGLSSKTTPVDADSISIVDSADSNKQKKATFLQVWTNYFKVKTDALYQAILVSGTNIKTVNGSSLLGSGDLTVAGGEDILQSSWQQSVFNCAHQIVGPLGGYVTNGGNIANDLNSPTSLPGFMNFLCYSSGTSANGGYRYITISANGGTAIKMQPGLTAFGCFCIYDNSSADTLIRMAFGSSTNLPTDHTNGVYLEITGSTAVFKSASAGTRTSTSSVTLTYSTALSSEIPYYFMIEVISSSLVNVKIVKHDGTVMLNTTLTSNIPASSVIMHCSVMGCIQTAGANRNILGISRIGFGVKKPTWLNSF